MKWKPISTAPKEKMVLVSAPNWAYPLALILTLTYPVRGGKPHYEWRDESGDSQQFYKPTHWIELPPVPGQRKRDREQIARLMIRLKLKPADVT